LRPVQLRIAKVKQTTTKRNRQHLVARDEIGFEFMPTLRLADGVPAALFAERTGLPLAIVARRARGGRGAD
ncbi:MAG: hypothetical protein MZW92_32925, partial [Comamonadaceae bacterium]|nr:hypothetical protein [Comamonadaceae bacterium]